jgi:hypothetical protein
MGLLSGCIICQAADEHARHHDGGENEHGILPNNGVRLRRVTPQLSAGKEEEAETRRDFDDDVNQEAIIVG